MPPFSVRCSKPLSDALIRFCEANPNIPKNQAIQYVLSRYFDKPRIYSPLSVRCLREPMTYPYSFTLPDEIAEQLTCFSNENHVNVSEIIRMSIYQELIQNAK